MANPRFYGKKGSSNKKIEFKFRCYKYGSTSPPIHFHTVLSSKAPPTALSSDFSSRFVFLQRSDLKAAAWRSQSCCRQMRFNINKACDLNSISVLPPQSRRGNASSTGADCSVLRMSQPSMLRSQSQQSLSQGLSLSQLSQSSFDEILTNDQRLGSEDQSSKRISSLPPITSKREDPSLQLPRSANNTSLCRWNSGQVNDEIDHRIGLMENNLTRIGRILDSVQSDVMQVNKAVKEVTIEAEGIRQKMIVQDNSLQLILKGEEDIKSYLEKSLKCCSEHLENKSDQIKLHEIASLVSALPDQIESQVSSLKDRVLQTFVKELKELKCGLKPSNDSQPIPSKSMRKSYTTRQRPRNFSMQNQAHETAKNYARSYLARNDEKVNSRKKIPYRRKSQNVETKQQVIALSKKEEDIKVHIESDDEIDMGFSCLLLDEQIGETSSFQQDVQKETMRILRKARRKRKYINTIILD